jgi:DNA-binding MarR family transcriptional regulator
MRRRRLRSHPNQYASRSGLGARPGIDQVTLSESLRSTVDDGTHRRQLAGGLIDKRPAANDRRANSLFITAKARRLLAAIEASADRSQAKILAPLRPAERRQFMRMVKTLLDGYTKRRNAQRPSS